MTNHLAVEIKDSVAVAPVYRGGYFKPATLNKAIIVRGGTENGNDTIDLQFVDEAGNAYVAMVTARLLKSVTDICNTDNVNKLIEEDQNRDR